MSSLSRLVALPLLLASLVSCVSPPITFEGPVASQGVEVGVEGVIRNFGHVIAVEGYALNATSTDLLSMSVVFELLDDWGAKVGDAEAKSAGLRAGQRWRFDAPARVKYRTRVARVRVERIELEPAPRN